MYIPPSSMVISAVPLRPAELVTLHVYVPNSSSPTLDNTRVWLVLVIVVEPLVVVRVHTRVKLLGLLLVTVQLRVVDPFTCSLVLVANTFTSGGSNTSIMIQWEYNILYYSVNALGWHRYVCGDAHNSTVKVQYFTL